MGVADRTSPASSTVVSNVTTPLTYARSASGGDSDRIAFTNFGGTYTSSCGTTVAGVSFGEAFVRVPFLRLLVVFGCDSLFLIAALLVPLAAALASRSGSTLSALAGSSLIGGSFARSGVGATAGPAGFSFGVVTLGEVLLGIALSFVSVS